MSEKPEKTAPDWERIELDYRAGIKTLRQIAAEQGISHGAINKRAKRDGWDRDLSVKIQAKAEALVSKAAVSTPVSMETRVAERQVIEANAQGIAEVLLGQRRDIQRAKTVAMSLLDELELQAGRENVELLQALGELLRAEDEHGRDRLNDLYQKIISLPERAKTMKALADSLRVCVDMQRQAFGMDAKGAAPDGSGTGGARIAVEFVSPRPRPEDDDE